MNTLKNRDLFSIFRDSNINFKNLKEVWEFVLTKNLFNISNLDEDKRKELKSNLNKFFARLTNRWEESGRIIDRFLKNR